MHKWIPVGMALFAGLGLGVIATKGFNGAQAQGRPPVYVVIDIAEMTDPEGFKAIPASPAALPPD